MANPPRNSWSSRAQITYDHLITDDGDSNLDRSSGLWTAGSTGVYQVSWSVQMSVPKSRRNRIYLMRWPFFCRRWQMIELLLLFRDGNRVSESLHDAYNYNSYYSSSYTDEVGGRTMVNTNLQNNKSNKKNQTLRDSALSLYFRQAE